jgi:hypothetical protein
MPGKRIQIDDDTWAALDLLARDRMMDFQELADEAFRDLLRKHGRPASLKVALRQVSARAPPSTIFRQSRSGGAPPPRIKRAGPLAPTRISPLWLWW